MTDIRLRYIGLSVLKFSIDVDRSRFLYFAKKDDGDYYLRSPTRKHIKVDEVW